MSSPAAIRATVPEQGRVLTFKRAVVVESWADLKIHLAASAATTASWAGRAATLLCTTLLLFAFAWAGLAFRRTA